MKQLKHTTFKIKQLWLKNRSLLAGLLFLGGTTAGNVNLLQQKAQQQSLLRNYSMIEAFRHGLCNSIGGYIEKADYIVDTIPVNRQLFQKGNALYSAESKEATKNASISFGVYKYRKGKKQVILNYFKPDTLSDTNLSAAEKQKILNFAKKHNDPTKQQMILAHEFHHQACVPNPDEQLKNVVNPQSLFSFRVTTFEDAKLCFHNEICGDINAFLMLREIYLQQRDLNILTERFPEYAKAVKCGQLNPGSPNLPEKNKERLFIAKYITARWKKDKSKYYEGYAERQTGVLINQGKYQQNCPGNEYRQALDFAYTFIMDGELVNLNYISNGEIADVEISAKLQQKLLAMLSQKNMPSNALNQAVVNKGNQR